MSPGEPRGPIVIDTDVFSADLVPRSRLTELYAPIVTGRPAFISFQTVAELRYGALRRGWGDARMLRLDAKVAKAEIVHTGPDLVLAQLLGADDVLANTLQEAVRLRTFNVHQLAERLDLTPQAANNRLRLLLRSGAVQRERSRPERGHGGREFRYTVPATA